MSFRHSQAVVEMLRSFGAFSTLSLMRHRLAFPKAGGESVEERPQQVVVVTDDSDVRDVHAHTMLWC